MCTIGLLFWSSTAVPSAAKCDGIMEPFGVSGDILPYLPPGHQCLERGDSLQYSVQDLIVNRLTPHHVDPKELESMRICKHHKVCITSANDLLWNLHVFFAGMVDSPQPKF